VSRRIFVSTAAFARPRGLWEILDAASAEGLDHVELGHCLVPETNRSELLGRLGCRRETFLVHNYFPPFAGDLVLNLASSDPAIESGSLAFVLDALELCSRLGAPFYSLHSGFVTDPIGFDGTSYILPKPDARATSEASERFLGNVATVVERAAELGLGLLLENSVCTHELAGKLLLMHEEEFVKLFETLAAPNLRILLDTGHLSVTSTTLGFDPVHFVDAVAPFIGAFHAHENDGEEDEHRPVSGGWILETLRRPQFARCPIIVEAKLTDASSLADHVRWLEDATRLSSPA
jgi:sugar phosphate isomerase/epimerase